MYHAIGVPPHICCCAGISNPKGPTNVEHIPRCPVIVRSITMNIPESYSVCYLKSIFLKQRLVLAVAQSHSPKVRGLEDKIDRDVWKIRLTGMWGVLGGM